MSSPPPGEGWYPDPYDGGVERWWTGGGWGTESRRPETRAPVAARLADRAAPGTSASPRRHVLWPVCTVLSGGLMILGAFLPWAQFESAFGERASLIGIHRGVDGWLAVAVGGVIAAAGAASWPRPYRSATLVADGAALAGVILSVYEFLHLDSVHDVLGAANVYATYDVSYGIGLGLVALAAVGALISAAGITGRHARSLIAP